jgi:hypothetical protein
LVLLKGDTKIDEDMSGYRYRWVDRLLRGRDVGLSRLAREEELSGTLISTVDKER